MICQSAIDADTSAVGKPRFSRITWDGEEHQHFIPAAVQIVPGFGVLCGMRGPEVLGEMNEIEEQIEKPMCRRCKRGLGEDQSAVVP